MDWVAIQTAIDELPGRAGRRNKLKTMRRKAVVRKDKHRSKRKIATLLAELQAADFTVFPTEILNSGMELSSFFFNEDELKMQDGLEIVSSELVSPAVEYWEAPARKQRANRAHALRMAKCRRLKKVQKANAQILKTCVHKHIVFVDDDGINR